LTPEVLSEEILFNLPPTESENRSNHNYDRNGNIKIGSIAHQDMLEEIRKQKNE